MRLVRVVDPSVPVWGTVWIMFSNQTRIIRFSDLHLAPTLCLILGVVTETIFTRPKQFHLLPCVRFKNRILSGEILVEKMMPLCTMHSQSFHFAWSPRNHVCLLANFKVESLFRVLTWPVWICRGHTKFVCHKLFTKAESTRSFLIGSEGWIFQDEGPPQTVPIDRIPTIYNVWNHLSTVIC